MIETFNTLHTIIRRLQRDLRVDDVRVMFYILDRLYIRVFTISNRGKSLSVERAIDPKDSLDYLVGSISRQLQSLI